ncbi:MAG: sigma-70 family RNA polymerase sigma factor [Lachnospiraceae bacterium]|nr:sigma-70 family RNA polymerase sigma factor [Lachnospiraceae bacterium]MBP3567851.1 sigma-70 family RNA polymerase sigma factor [Lachnospiraceae bacterium]
MNHSSVRPTDVLEEILNQYGTMLFRYALMMLNDTSEAEDVVQDTLLIYWQKSPVFNDKDHEKAWLLTVTVNRCRDLLRKRMRRGETSLDNVAEVADIAAELSEDSGILEALIQLPEKYKKVLYLYYVEEYRIEDIAGIIGKTASAVKMRLKKGRELLGEKYRKEFM